jgi:predicted nuclease of predicted toxin-antitoxin system
MRFLADESCDFRVVRALRSAGHDVVAVIEIAPGSADQEVLSAAVADDRIFITEDRDFGQLVFASHASSCGVILIRFPPRRVSGCQPW